MSIDIQLDITHLTQAATVASIQGYWFIWFNVNGAQPIPSADTVGTSHLKNQVFHMDGWSVVTPTTALSATESIPKVWRLRINVPKAWQTLQDGDKIQIVYLSTTTQSVHNIKFQAIYKEYQA